MSELIEYSREVIAAGSKSFAFASRMFDLERRNGAALLYSWCRYCDDQIDQTEKNAQLERLHSLRHRTQLAFNGSPQTEQVFLAFQKVVLTYSIPEQYAFDLLHGMEMDVRGQTYETLSDLLRYCYCVAGTVGLMMVHVMGISDQRALRNAVELGQAMQLINICRDILEDAEMGRVYLPLSWMKEAGIPPEKISDPIYRQKVAILVKRLLHAAETLCFSGDQGLKYLSFRAALAVAAAREIYWGIGKTVIRRGGRAWDQRAVVPTWIKVFLAFRGFLKVLGTVPGRLMSPWTPVPISQVWRHS